MPLVFYCNLNPEKKKKTKAILLNLIAKRKEQIESIEDSIIKCMKDDIKAAENVLNNSMQRMDINEFLRQNKIRSDYILKFFGALQNK